MLDDPRAAWAAYKLHKLLQSVNIHFHGVSIGDPDDKSTWEVQFAEGATVGQAKMADDLIAAMEITPPPDTQDVEVVKNYQKLQAIRDMSPQQFIDMWDNRYPPITTQAQAIQALNRLIDDVKTIGLAILILARRI